MILSRDVGAGGAIWLDLETLEPEEALGLVRLFDGCGELFFSDHGNGRGRLYWTWLRSSDVAGWGDRSRVLRRRLQDLEFEESLIRAMKEPVL